jgi:sulfur-carrier protein
VRLGVHVAPYLRRWTGGADEVVIDVPGGADVRAALAALFLRHPGLRDRILTEPGEVRMQVNIFINEDSIRTLGGLAAPVPEGAGLWILAAVSGG